MASSKKVPVWLQTYGAICTVVVTGWLLYSLPKVFMLTVYYLAAVGKTLFPYIGG